MNAGCQCIFSPYNLTNARVEGYDVVVNKPKAAAYRAPGAPAAAFAAETVVDELCEQLGMDPIEFRLLNGSHEGTRQIAGPRFPRIGLLDMLQVAKTHPHYTTPLEGPYRGRGVAGGYWHNSTGPACAIISVNADGTVNLVEGSMDIGGSRAAAAMHVAEVLGIAYDAVRPSVGDTESIGFTSTTGGSSATFKTGWACYQAAHDVKGQMIERAAKLWEVTPDDVEYTKGVLSDRRNPERRMTLQRAGATAECDRRPDHRPCQSGATWCRGRLRLPYRRCRGRSGDRQDADLALYGPAGRRQGHPSQLCGRANPGRHRAGDRLGLERGICL